MFNRPKDFVADLNVTQQSEPTLRSVTWTLSQIQNTLTRLENKIDSLDRRINQLQFGSQNNYEVPGQQGIGIETPIVSWKQR